MASSEEGTRIAERGAEDETHGEQKTVTEEQGEPGGEAAAHSDVGEAAEKAVSDGFDAPLPVTLTAISLRYCGVCKLPVEYCEFTDTYRQECIPWMEANMAGDELQVAMGELTVDDAGAAEEAGDKSSGKVKKKKKISSKRAAQGGPAKASGEQRVVVTLSKRNKRKFVTNVSGLDTFPDVRMKDAAKALGRRFATGSSVSTNASGGKEIIIQGDVLIDIEDVLTNNFSIPGEKIIVLRD